MRVGVYGGTFDPIHIGHIKAVGYAMENADLDVIHVVVAGDPPQKQTPKVDALKRFRWVQESIEDEYPNNTNIIVDDREINRIGVSYTIDTIKDLKENYDTAEFILVVGEDLPDKIHTWKSSEELLELVSIFVVPRTIYPTSSTEIRELISQKGSVSGLLPEKIERDILENSLYNIDT